MGRGLHHDGTECDMEPGKPHKRRRIDPPEPRKLSEIIWEYAGDFISTGDTPERRQSHLNAACNAWTIACDPPEARQKDLKRYMAEYQRFNPGADEEELAGVRIAMEKLIERKLKVFPGDLRQIVGARIFKSGEHDRVEIMSVRPRHWLDG
jgi:hypothetical protein